MATVTASDVAADIVDALAAMRPKSLPAKDLDADGECQQQDG